MKKTEAAMRPGAVVCPGCNGDGLGFDANSRMSSCPKCDGSGVAPTYVPLRPKLPDYVRTALERVASGSPAIHTNASGDHHCAQCAAYIDEARAVLGWAKLPAQARTPA